MCTDWGTSSCNMVSDIMFYGVVPIMWFGKISKFDKIAANLLVDCVVGNVGLGEDVWVTIP